MIALLFVVGLGFMAVERCWPANDLPKVRAWWPRVILINVLNIILVTAIGVAWTKWLGPWSVFKLSSHLQYYWSGLIAYLVACFAYYWWHRFRHESNFFWRVCHQLHHSPQRIEVVMAFYKHPVEIFLNALLSSAISYGLLGCSVEAAAVCSVLACLAEFFYHWNIKTPVWLGYFLQRPESHRIHHERARHTSNYADLAVLDMLFGTFRNSRKDESVQCGFGAQAEDRFEDMLAMRDVNGEAARRSPLHFLPVCIGCHKRWACHEARNAKIHQPG